VIEQEPCVKCGIEITDNAVIYTREKVNDRWGTHPICTKCWYQENPDRIPVRLNYGDM